MAGSEQVEVADGSLRPLIRAVLKGAFDNAPLKKGDWIRVSSLAAMCPRAEVLCGLEGIERDDPYNGDLGLVFEHGHALHWGLQNRILPLTGTFLGQWLCVSCGHVMGGWDPKAKPRKSIIDSQIPRPACCDACKRPLDSDTCLYQEQHFFNHEFRIKGHPDGFLRVPGLEGVGIFEAKSINPKGAWEVRGCPKLDHVVQVQCYMLLTGCKWAKILYWDKAGMGTNQLIEHTVEYDDYLIETVKDEITSIWVGLEDGVLPTRTCETITCPRAKRCKVANQCFERD